MPTTLIFDLPNVLIAGWDGLEKPLAARLGVPASTIRPAFSGFLLEMVCCGVISEDVYLRLLCEHRGWNIEPAELAGYLHENFRRAIPGMEALVQQLAGRYQLVVFADLAVEWAGEVRAAHPWLRHFEAQCFSYELRLTRRDPRAFRQVARRVRQLANECLVVDRNPAQLRAAAAAGLRGLLFRSAEQVAQDLALLSVA